MFKKILLLTLSLSFSAIVFSNSAQVTLEWPSVKTADYYKLYRSAKIFSPKSTKNILPKKWTKTEFIDNGIQENTQYYYWLKNCKTNDKCSGFDSLVGVYIPSSVPIIPHKPKRIVHTQKTKTLIKKPIEIVKVKKIKKVSILKQKVKSHPKWEPKVLLDWSGIKANYYKINRGTGGYGKWGNNILPKDFTGTEFIDKDLNENTTYYYWIKTCKSRNSCSDFSALIGVTII
jgi:hypothetical protein